MATKQKPLSGDHPVVVTFLIFAIIGFMALAADVLKPLALAVLLSFALVPITRLLEGRGLPRAFAVVLTVVLALGVVAGIGYMVGHELTTLANDLPKYQGNILKKVEQFQGVKVGPLEKATNVLKGVAQHLETKRPSDDVVRVSVVSQPSLSEQIRTAVGPYLEFLGEMAFVLILVLFLLVNREDMGDRLIGLFGRSRVSVTTKTLEEAGQRISRYLMMFATVNSAVGLIVGVGLWLIGLPYAALWGVLAAALRFIPYVGPGTAMLLPFLFSIANAPGASWHQPVMILAFFGILEACANTFLEPVIYGRTTGVSALGLLVAAMFWTWLWGSLGLLLSTPLTVCLAVLGRSVPALRFFGKLLGEEGGLDPDMRFYQRLLAMDQDGAVEVVDAVLKQRPRAEAFDEILVPTLARTERDRRRGNLDEREVVFIWRVINDLLDDLGEQPEYDLKTLAPAAEGAAQPADPSPKPPAHRIQGIPTFDRGDTLVLKMLGVLLAPAGIQLDIAAKPKSPLQLADRMADSPPELVVISNLPSQRATRARYICRRLHARLNDLPVVVGLWGASGESKELLEQVTESGACQLVIRLTEARERILNRFAPRPDLEAKPPLAGMPGDLQPTPSSGPATAPAHP